MKSTIKVIDLINETNRLLKIKELSQDEKKALCEFLASILHKTGNYKGFLYQFEWPQKDTPNYEERLKMARSIEYNRIYLIRSKLLPNDKAA